jgi:hypothetical protein
MPPEFRRCSKCGGEKPITLFRKRIKHKNGLVYHDSWCNPCTAEDAKRRNRERYDQIVALKLAQGCADCGYNAHPAALDFDHRPGEVKLFTVSLGSTSKGIQTLLAEVAKCDVVCANCHRVRTWERSQAHAS